MVMDGLGTGRFSPKPPLPRDIALSAAASAQSGPPVAVGTRRREHFRNESVPLVQHPPHFKNESRMPSRHPEPSYDRVTIYRVCVILGRTAIESDWPALS